MEAWIANLSTLIQTLLTLAIDTQNMGTRRKLFVEMEIFIYCTQIMTPVPSQKKKLNKYASSQIHCLIM